MILQPQPFPLLDYVMNNIDKINSLTLHLSGMHHNYMHVFPKINVIHMILCVIYSCGTSWLHSDACINISSGCLYISYECTYIHICMYDATCILVLCNQEA